MKSNQGVKVEKSITVKKPAAELFDFWRHLENLPIVMRHLNSVVEHNNGYQSHWVAQAPLGQTVEWDAVILSEKPNEMISWASLPGSEVDTAGSVHFKSLAGGRETEVSVNLKYNPPGGLAGVLVAKLWGKDAASEIEEDLECFKTSMEKDNLEEDLSRWNSDYVGEPPKKE